ncbi:MAG: two-component system NarL family sensor kinase [Crocinitomix sp.]|jgi:two-component system NarL family sensor kinase
MINLIKYLIGAVFVLSSFKGVGQVQDFNLVNSLNDSSYYLGSSSPKLALEIANKSQLLAQSIDYKFGEIMAYCRKGNALVEMDELDSALFNYKEAEQLFNSSDEDSILLAKIYIYQGPIYRKKGMTDWALSIYHSAFRIAEQHADGALMGSTIINMSLIFKQQGDYKSAMNLLHQAARILPKDNKDELGAVYNGIGNIYQNEDRIKEAIVAFKIAASFFQHNNNLSALLRVNTNIGNCFWDLEMRDSALFFYNEALPIAKKNSFKETESIIYHDKGEIFIEQGLLDSAIIYFKKSLKIKEDAGDLDGRIISLISIAEAAFLKNNIDEALAYYQEAYELALPLGYLEDLEQITRELAVCHQKKNNWVKAMENIELSQHFQDSISEMLNQALVYEINYEQEKRKVTELQMLVGEQDSQIEKQTYFICGIVFIAFCLILVLYILFKLNKHKRKTVEVEKKSIEKEKELSELINSQEQAELSAMYNGQESERNRIAMELHDKLGGMLSTVKLYFKSIDKQINLLKDENVQQYQKANVLLDEACDETRKMAHQLSSKSMGRIGLFATVNKMQKQISDSGQIKFELRTHGTDDGLKMLNQISIYRIIQELVNNILKHAIATEINVQLNVFPNIFNLIIEDDGIGFDLNQMVNNSGIGLRETEARVKNMDGTFSIDSGRGGGTTITIDIPLKKEEE